MGVRLGDRLAGPLPHGHFDLGRGLRMAVWWAIIERGDPTPLADHDALAWLGAGQLHDVGWLAADLPVVRAVAARLGPERVAADRVPDIGEGARR